MSIDILMRPDTAPDQADAELHDLIYGTPGIPHNEEYVFDSLAREGDLDEQLEAFLVSDGQRSIDFTPQHVDLTETDERAARLAEMQRRIAEHLPDDPLLQVAYHNRTNEELAGLAMVRAAVTGNAKAYRATNEYISGKPDRTIFGAVADWYCDMAVDTMQKDKRPEVQQAAVDVLISLGAFRGHDGNDRSLLVPDQATFEAVRQREYESGYLGLVMNGIQIARNAAEAQKLVKPADGLVIVSDTAYGRGEVSAITKKMLGNIGSDMGIIAGPDWMVSRSRNAVVMPPEFEAPMPGYDVVEFNTHELRHVIEAIMARMGKVALAETGFDRYEIGNEGGGVNVEQLTNEKISDFTGRDRWNQLLERFLGSALAAGYGGGNASAPETYKVLRAVNRLFEYSRPEAGGSKDLSAVTDKADRAAVGILKGAYKGTNGDGRAGGNQRPTSYLKGSVDNWRNSHLMPYGFLGKFNISRPDHVRIMRHYGAFDMVEN